MDFKLYIHSSIHPSIHPSYPFILWGSQEELVQYQRQDTPWTGRQHDFQLSVSLIDMKLLQFNYLRQGSSVFLCVFWFACRVEASCSIWLYDQIDTLHLGGEKRARDKYLFHLNKAAKRHWTPSPEDFQREGEWKRPDFITKKYIKQQNNLSGAKSMRWRAPLVLEAMTEVPGRVPQCLVFFSAASSRLLPASVCARSAPRALHSCGCRWWQVG